MNAPAATYRVGDPITYTDDDGEVVHTTIHSIQYGHLGVWDENTERGRWLLPSELDSHTPAGGAR